MGEAVDHAPPGLVSEVDPASTPARRVAFVITRSDAVGGAQVHVFELARALRDAGHAVAVFVGGEGPFVQQLRAAAIAVWPVADLQREIRPLADARALAALRTALVAFNPDLVSCHSTKAGWWGRVIARTLGVPSVATAHGWLLTEGRLAPWQRVVWAAELATGALAERIIVVSEYDRRIALQHRVAPASKLAVIHNALPDVGADRLARPERAPPRIVMTARFEWPKDHVTLIEALASLRELPWTLELVGDGPDRATVETAIATTKLRDRVELVGTRDDVPQRLAAAQLFVLSSRREGFPISVLEAMRAGLPVVASDVGGIAEAVRPGQTGAVVEAGSLRAMAAALEPLLRDAALRVRQGAAARARFLEAFAFERHVRRVWAVYLQAMQSRRRARR
jgi:glycosyltransferase involved in cell wall biosynthesis